MKWRNSPYFRPCAALRSSEDAAGSSIRMVFLRGMLRIHLRKLPFERFIDLFQGAATKTYSGPSHFGANLFHLLDQRRPFMLANPVSIEFPLGNQAFNARNGKVSCFREGVVRQFAFMHIFTA